MQDLSETLAGLHDLEAVLVAVPSLYESRVEAEKSVESFRDLNLEVSGWCSANPASVEWWNGLSLPDLVEYKNTLETCIQKNQDLKNDAVEAIRDLIPRLSDESEESRWRKELTHIESDTTLKAVMRSREHFMQYAGPRVVRLLQDQLSECKATYTDVHALQDEFMSLTKMYYESFEKKCASRIADVRKRHERDLQASSEVMSWVRYHAIGSEQPKRIAPTPVVPESTAGQRKSKYDI